ncbi:MAG: hypothetical protein FWD44_10065 [Oscillospiraceae bacterium]|nr:hypothetical protein [Oscillospiraceae bacterium]
MKRIKIRKTLAAALALILLLTMAPIFSIAAEDDPVEGIPAESGDLVESGDPGEAEPIVSLSTGTDITDAFTDEVFRAYIRNLLSLDEGDPITAEDAATITSVFVSQGMGVKSVAGLEYLTEITELTIYEPITTLDLSKNTKLNQISLSRTELTTLDVSHLTMLEGLGVTGFGTWDPSAIRWSNIGKLTSIKLPEAPCLQELNLSNNKLTSIDLSKSTELWSLSLSDNLLTSIDISHNTKLSQVWLDYNKISSINISKNTGLQYFNIVDNLLTSIDLSANVKMFSLNLTDNRLTTIDVSNLITMPWLFVSGNRMASIDAIVGLDKTWVKIDDVHGFIFNPQHPISDTIDKGLEDALKNDIPLIIAQGGSTAISAANLQAIKAQENPLDIVLPSGLTVTIDPASITTAARSIDLNVAVSTVSEASTVNGARVPANSLVIAPTATGEFGFTIEFTISAAEIAAAGLKANEIKLYYINSNGQVRSDIGEITLNSNGSVTVKIKQASRYVLANESTPPTSRSPQTGDEGTVIFSITLISLGVICIAGAEVYRRKCKKTKSN